jgi:aminoglycoside phosphotransferase (APT) family kinase protein
LSDLGEQLNLIAGRSLDAPGVTNLRRLSGGATQELWRFELQDRSGTRLVLRRAPPGDRRFVETAGLEVEARLMRMAKAAGAPVPDIRYVLAPEDGAGSGFIMSYIEGETLGGRIVKDPALATARAGLARQCGGILAKIHSIDPSLAPSLKRSTPAELVEEWRRRYVASDWPRPVFDLTFRWLQDHCPPAPVQPKLVHGDFRNGNLMIGPDGVRAVLDWELAHVGDPLEDLAWICVNAWRFGAIDKPVGGFGQREDLYAGYEAAGGQIERDRIQFWEVFGTLRWGVMCAGMTAMFRGPDPTVERAVIARRTSETEIDLMRLLASA